MRINSLSKLGALAFLALVLASLTGCSPSTAHPPAAADSTAKGDAREFVGSASCRECHEKFYQLWAPSHHGLAMQSYAIARTNLTEHQAELKIGNHSYRADIAKGVVVARGPGGEKSYPIEQALGGKNVLYFLTPFERGRLQVLPLAYDIRRKEWYDTAGSAVRHFPMQADEALHWTESPYTFNTSCFSCHVSQLTNNYTLKSDTYSTTWGEPGINCETCHGPASKHVQVARETPQGQPMKDLHLIRVKTMPPDQVNSLCASCHGRLYPLTSTFMPGDKFFDHFGLVTIENPDWYPDGRELGEDFTYTSWRLSPCLKDPKFNCVSCHTSSGRYRFKGEQANHACLPCHEDKVKHVAAHSHHEAGTDGAKCVSCHMPMTEFARMTRSDHSMRPPMPAATLAFGSPNACNLCHTNKSAAWADGEVRKWHKKDYQAPVLQRGGWLAAARKRDWSKLPEIVKYLSSPEREEVWAAALVQTLRGCEDESKWPGILACLKDASPLVRVAAVEAISDQLRPETLAPVVAATRDQSRLVRVRAAGALAGVPAEMLPEADRESINKATEELLASFAARPDDAASWHNLGNFRVERREFGQAIEAFETALKLNPQNISTLVNVSLAYNAAGRNDKAEASLRQALRLDSTNAAVQLNLGMLLAEMNQLSEAEQAFRAAFKADPQSAQAAFNLGVMLSKEQPEEGLLWCRRAAELRPAEPRYAYTLAFFQHQHGKSDEAVSTLENLLQQAPAHAESYGLLGQIYEEQKKPAQALSVYRRAAENQKLPPAERNAFSERAQALSSRQGP